MIPDGCEIRDVVEDGGAVIRYGCDTGRVYTGVMYGMLWKVEERCGRGKEDGGVDGTRRGSETGCAQMWTGVWMEDGGERDWVWTRVDGGVDGRRRGARLGVDGCGRDGRRRETRLVWTGVDEGCGWKMAGSETGCGRVWTVVWMEDGGEREWVRTGVVWTEDEGERGWVWTRVDGGLDGRRRVARLGVDGCGQGFGWKIRGARLGVDGCGQGCGVWTGVDGVVD